MTLPSRDAQRGSSLLEAVIAAGVLATVLTGILPLATTAVAGSAAARVDLMTAHLARQRLAQLQALTHLRGVLGVVVDVEARLDGAEAFAAGGAGLSPTGLAPFQVSTAPLVDWLDEHGGWQAAGADPPPGARYRRRWGILAPAPAGCLSLWVEVTPLGPDAAHRMAHAGGVQCAWGSSAP